MDILLIGSGINSLVAALRLAHAGHRPLVLNGGSTPGQETLEALDKDFPSLGLSHGEVLSPLLGSLGLQAQGLGFQKIQPGVLIPPRLDAEAFYLPEDASKALPFLSSPEDGAALTQLMGWVGKLQKLLAGPLTAPPPPLPPGLGDLTRWAPTALRARALGSKMLTELARGIPSSLRDFLQERFSDPVLQATLAGDALPGLAHGPWAPHSTLNWFLARILRRTGSVLHWPVGGPTAVARALIQAVEAAGGEVRFHSEVIAITGKPGRVDGVELKSGEKISAPVVLSSLDPVRTHFHLRPAGDLSPTQARSVQAIRMRGRMAVMHLLLSKLPQSALPEGLGTQEAGQATIRLARSLEELERAADAAKYRQIPERPAVEAFFPSHFDTTMTREGRHLASIHIHYVPFELESGQWSDYRETLGDRVLELLEEALPGLSDTVQKRRVWTPVDLQNSLGLTGGHPFQGEIAPDQVFFMRPLPESSQYKTFVEGLYLCGEATHPGGGSGGLCGHNAAQAVLKDIASGTLNP